MRREQCRESLSAVGLAWMMGCATAGCLMTAFGMEVESFFRLIALWGVTAAWGGFTFRWHWGELATACIVAVAAGYLWHGETFWEQLASVLNCVTLRYNGAYGWGVVRLENYAGDGPVDLILGIVGCAAALSVSWTVTGRRSAVCALLAVILPMAACFVVTDTVPAALWLYLLVLGVVLLLMTDYARRRKNGGSAALMAYLIVPVAAALGALFLLMPQQRYVNNAGNFSQKLSAWASGTLEQVGTGSAPKPHADVDLSAIGPQSRWNYTVMEVTASESGVYYLRGKDYDGYTGTGWSVGNERSERFGGGSGSATLTVKTRSRVSTRYLPYYPAAEVTLSGGQLQNDNATQYSYTLTDAAVADLGEGDYLLLPEETARWAVKLASEILGQKTPDQTDTAAIADYVRASADYDLGTPRMPEEESDFARWFLRESDTGYCAHFATAAVVLLRAAGIPARYVTGYVASCQAGQTVQVPEYAAHAWAEYYSEEKSAWVVLEATPVDLTEQPQTVAPTQATSENEVQTAPEVMTEAPATGFVEEIRESMQDEVKKKEPPRWLWAAVWLAAGVAAVSGQSILRHKRAKYRRNRGGVNAQALECWRQCHRLARLLGTRPPKALEELALKAKFSRHTLTTGELDAFEIWQKQALGRLKKKPFPIRLYSAVVFGIW